MIINNFPEYYISQYFSFVFKTPLENVPGNLSPIKDPDRLLQDVDINRLRAVVFRDVVSFKSAWLPCKNKKQTITTNLHGHFVKQCKICKELLLLQSFCLDILHSSDSKIVGLYFFQKVIDSLLLKNGMYAYRAWKIAHWVKFLLQKYEDLNSDPLGLCRI